jgi:hypothetical protein
LSYSLIHCQEDDTVTSDAYNSFGSFARPESSSIQRQVLPQQQDSVISVRGHTWIDKDSNARKSSGASPRSTTVNDVQQNWRREKENSLLFGWVESMQLKKKKKGAALTGYWAHDKLFNVDCLQSWHVLHHSIVF